MTIELTLAVRWTVKYAPTGDRASPVMLVASLLTGEGWGMAHAWTTAERAWDLAV